MSPIYTAYDASFALKFMLLRQFYASLKAEQNSAILGNRLRC